MRGAGQTPPANNPTITAAFRAQLGHQFLIVLIMAIVLILAWNTIRTIRYRRAVSTGTFHPPVPGHRLRGEPAARRLLRIAFGMLWIVDGLLQAQVSMPSGLPDAVLKPAASSSPGWVQHLVNVGITAWSDHPVSAAAATVWIQVGIGIFLLIAPRGYWSRSAGAVSAAWGLVVWVFGEAFGGIFAPGSSWLFGTPGAALLYVAAGILVALPDARWDTPRLGRGILRGTGVFFIGMGILQAWPGRGTWSTPAGETGGTLAAVARAMAHLSQPSVFSAGPRSFASFDAAHGWVVNLVLVVLLIGIGLTLAAGRRRLLRVGVIAGGVLCLLDWVLVQDFGVFGGVGTDPNSMIPMALLLTAGYLGVVKLPAVAPAPADAPPSPAAAPGGLLGSLSPSYLTRSLAALGAVGIVLLGAAPLALAASNPNADAIVSEASDGTPNVVETPAAPFTLTDQTGHAVSLRSLVGHVVVLTFLDPVCTTDCPLIAQELRATDQLLGSDASRVDLVAVVNNPLYNAPAFTVAFDKQEGLSRLSNWTFLTGSLAELERVWSDYGEQSAVSPAGAMIAHSDIVYIIDGRGRTREVLDADPGAGTVASKSSFSSLLASQVEHIVQS